jgi:hypothetical protein
MSLQEAKRMLADVVCQSRATAAIGGCSGAAGPSSQLPSSVALFTPFIDFSCFCQSSRMHVNTWFLCTFRYSRAYDLSLSVTKWGQSSGDGADKQEEVKRQKR